MAVSHGLGPNLAAFRGFRRRYSKVCSWLEPIFSFHFSFFLMGFVSDVSRVFVVAVSHGLGPNLAAVRGFRRRYSKARFRDAFEASFV